MRRPIEDDVTARWVDAAHGGRLRVVEAGSGAAVVLVPGWTMGWTAFERQIPTFARSHRVVAFDPRSQGESTTTVDGNEYAQHGRDLETVVDALGIERFALIGWSYGALACYAYLDQLGCDRVERLVVLDQTPRPYACEHEATWSEADWATFRNEMLLPLAGDRTAFVHDAGTRSSPGSLPPAAPSCRRSATHWADALGRRGDRRSRIDAPPDRRGGALDAHGHQGPDAPGDRHRLVAAAALVRRRPVGPAARHGTPRRPLPRAVPRRALDGDRRPGAGRARHPHERRLPPRRGLRRPLVAPLPAAALEGLRARGAPVRGLARPAARVPARDADERDRDDVALAAGGGQGRARPAQPARVRQALADRPGARGQAGQVRDVLVAGALDLPRQPHARVRPRGQAAADLGHGHRDEPRTATARGRRRQGDPDRGADDPLRRAVLPRPDGAARLPRRGVQPRGGRPRRRRAVDPHLLGQPEHAEGLHRRVVRATRSRSTSSASRATSGRSRRPRTSWPRSTCSSRTPTGSRRRSPSAS